MENQKEIRIKLPASTLLVVLLFLALIFSIIHVVFAAAPNPGHNFTEIGGGAVQGDILYGSATDMVAALPKNTSATRYLSNTGTSNNPAWAQVDMSSGVTNILTVANGGTGWANLQPNTVLLGNGTGAVGTTSPGTAGFVLALSNGVPTWIATSTLATISGILGLSNGGTGATLAASNGGILYSDASAMAVLGGTATAGQILRSGSSGAPSWSTATYPAAVGVSGQVLMSNGTNWISAATSSYPTVTVVTKPVLATGAITTGTAFGTSLIIGQVGLFNVPNPITINQLTYNVTISGTTPSYTVKVCIYDEGNTTKIIDVTSGAETASGNFSVTVSPAVTLNPGNYYIMIGLASQSGTTPTFAVSTWTTTAATWINTSATPAGKKIYEGTVAKASAVCDATLGTITGTITKTPVVRLDN
jgi:hypothetical protein